MKFLTLLYYSCRSLLLRGPLATLQLYRSEIAGDRLFGISTRAFVYQSTAGRHHYQAASYWVLEKIFKSLSHLHLPKRFVDIGCGLGRVLVVAKHNNYDDCIGIEVNPQLVNAGKLGLERKSYQSIQMIESDATLFDYGTSPNTFFLFNPFGAEILETVLQKIEKDNHSVHFFIYMNPVHRRVFERRAYQEVLRVKTNFYTEAIVYQSPS